MTLYVVVNYQGLRFAWGLQLSVANNLVASTFPLSLGFSSTWVQCCKTWAHIRITWRVCEARLQGPALVSHSVGLVQRGPEICIFNKFSVLTLLFRDPNLRTITQQNSSSWMSFPKPPMFQGMILRKDTETEDLSWFVTMFLIFYLTMIVI